MTLIITLSILVFRQNASIEAKLSELRKQLESVFGIDVDISIKEIGGLFDNPPFIPFS